ncbi:MAG: zinc-binding dehydrogenase [Candidatus Micrarchaeota archaeon]|nr:zinc-binding dehydrogenase [Candidatus Micrarchaeota archaeon]
MNAVGFREYGNENVLELMDVEDPVPGSGEVVMRVRYTSMNMLDVLVRKGYSRTGATLPHVPGADVVGTVERLGGNVHGFGIGDTAIAHTLFGCGHCKSCASMDESVCSEWKVVGRDIWGSYGELVKLPASLLATPPEHYEMKELACMPLSLSVTWRAISTLASAEEGNSVVIRGASGNAGIFATLLSKAMGLQVLAITRSGEKAVSLKRIGADVVISASAADEQKVEVLDATDGKGADFVLESLGSTIEQSVEMLKDGGKVILYGTAAGSNATIDVKKIYLHSRSVIGTHASGKKEFESALSFMSSKNIRPVIGRLIDIKEASKAHAMLQNSEVFGKIVLEHRW